MHQITRIHLASPARVTQPLLLQLLRLHLLPRAGGWGSRACSPPPRHACPPAPQRGFGMGVAEQSSGVKPAVHMSSSACGCAVQVAGCAANPARTTCLIHNRH